MIEENIVIELLCMMAPHDYDSVTYELNYDFISICSVSSWFGAQFKLRLFERTTLILLELQLS